MVISLQYRRGLITRISTLEKKDSKQVKEHIENKHGIYDWKTHN